MVSEDVHARVRREEVNRGVQERQEGESWPSMRQAISEVSDSHM